jgi:hypothetical protein
MNFLVKIKLNDHDPRVTMVVYHAKGASGRHHLTAGGCGLGSARELELPPEWDRQHPLKTFLQLLFLGLAAVLMITVGLFIGGTGGLGMLLGGVGTAVLVFGVARRVLRRSSLRAFDLAATEDGTPVLRIRRSRALPVTLFLTFGAGCLLVGWYLFGVGDPEAAYFTVCGLLLTGFLFAAIIMDPEELRLDPNQVTLRDFGEGRTTTWENVVRIEATGGGPYKREIVLIISYIPPITIAGGAYPLDPVLLLHLLRFYHEQPLARPELGTDTSLQRIREARFIP